MRSGRKLVSAMVVVLGMSTQAVSGDLDSAVDWYRSENYAAAFAAFDELAKADDIVAKMYLGVMYQYGQGVDVDHRKALALYTESAEAGDAAAQYYLAQFYMHAPGDVIVIDHAKAFAWHKRSADQGDPWAQLEVGNAYDMGLSVPEDDAEAVTWYRKAAEQGVPDAEYLWGLSLLKGHGGLAIDKAAAREWLQRAADHGVDRAQALIDGM